MKIAGRSAFCFSITTAIKLQRRQVSGLGMVMPTAKALLLELTVPEADAKPFRRTLINDAMITAAVRRSSDKELLVVMRGANELPSGVIREWMSDLYVQLWDTAIVEGKPSLDTRILPPWSGFSTFETAATSPSAVEVMTDRKDLDLAAINKERIALGLGNLQYLSLPEIAAGAYDDAFYFLEDPAGHVPRFRNVACGGTFDHLHNGHKKLLTLAASCCDGVLTVGVTSDSMLKAKEFAFLLESSEQRVARVKDFLQQIRPDLATRVVVITDPLGPPGVEADFDAIVVSSETIGGGLKINDVRKDRGFPPMQVLVTRRTTASTLSSSFVRQVIHKRAQPGW